jgi:hypothetical protein
MTSAGLLSTTKIVMSAPLPRVFEDVGGKVQPVGTGPGSSNAVIGGEFKSEDLTRATKEVVCQVHKGLWHHMCCCVYLYDLC